MNSASWIIFGLAYILGLLFTVAAWGKFALLGLGVAAGFTAPRLWRTGPRRYIWFIAGVVGLLAALYLQVRSPIPAADDISKFIPAVETREQVVTVQGKILTAPRLTRSGRSQFLLLSNQLSEIQGSGKKPADNNQQVKGKLYVTLPLLKATGLHPGQAIAVTGVLYKPKPAANPGGFDFQAYLAQEGIFAGLKGRQITIPDDSNSNWGWWQIRQRIIRAQVQGLGVPEGPFVSAMVLGNRVVDVPFYISDSFIRTGLAHALAASGFQVSLILGVILVLTRRFPVGIQFSAGITALLIFVALTGLQPSVLRAVVMGIGGLIALVQKRRVKMLGSLLVAAVILLLFNPLWIWDLGFQLSFLATLGLVVSATPISKKLDWLPPTFASIIAVPLAATLWTLPLQLFAFGLVSPYSIVVNVISSIPLSLISIGAFISAIAATIMPPVGSVLAGLLYYPTHILIAIVQFFSQLPGNSVAVGKISILQFIVLYTLICLVWWQRWWQKRWWLAGAIAVSLVVIPVWQIKDNLFRVTVLSTTGEPVMVIQNRGQVILVNSGDDNTARFTVVPFLQQQGINHIDLAVEIDSSSKNKGAWLQILERMPVKMLYTSSGSIAIDKLNQKPLLVGQNLAIGTNAIKLVSANPVVLQMQIRDQTWLLLQNSHPTEPKQFTSQSLPQAQVLWWGGELLKADVLQAIQPQVAIASAATIDRDTAKQLKKINTKIYSTGNDGALQWTPDQGFETLLESPEKDASVL